MKKLKVILVLSFGLIFSQYSLGIVCPGSGQISKQEFVKNPDSTTLSQVVRDNSPHYMINFDCFAKNSTSTLFSNISKTEAYIFGDNHAGNWTLGPLNEKLEFFMADLDDAGSGSLLSDINRLILNTYAVAINNKAKQGKFRPIAEALLQEYIIGLKGSFKPASDFIKSKTSISFTEYKDLEEKFAEKWSQQGNFVYKKDELIDVTPNTLKSFLKTEISKSLQKSSVGTKNSRLLDLGIRLKERGGSAKLMRYWALVERPDQSLQIIEFKELGISAVSLIENQEPTVPLFERLKNTLWPSNEDNYVITKLQDKNFVMRPKKIETGLTVPYAQNNEKDYIELMEYAKRVSYLTGLAHGEQLKNSSYLSALDSNKSEVIEALREFDKAYLDFIKSY